MSTIWSFGVGNGDMFAIQHDGGDLTIIDSCLTQYRAHEILRKLREVRGNGGVVRLIITHPDEDHIRGIGILFEHFPDMQVFAPYCSRPPVKQDPSVSFLIYQQLVRAGKIQSLFSVSNKPGSTLDAGSIGASLECHWPKPTFDLASIFRSAAECGRDFNNYSPILSYRFANGMSMVWMGDMETSALSRIPEDVFPSEIDILVAPHHGRKSAKVPQELLERMSPQVILIGEASSDHLHYKYPCRTITQNTWKNITIREMGQYLSITGTDRLLSTIEEVYCKATPTGSMLIMSRVKWLPLLFPKK